MDILTQKKTPTERTIDVDWECSKKARGFQRKICTVGSISKARKQKS